MDYRGAKLCNVPDHVGRGQICKFPTNQITWSFSGGLPGFSDMDIKGVFQRAWDAWSKVCGIQATYTGNARTANATIGFGPIDGGGGTLAYFELPCGVTHVSGRFDRAEDFVIAENPPSNKIGLLHVATHEFGHGIGIGHLQPGNLMQPTYDPRVSTPQIGDITEALARYGQPGGNPAIPDQPSNPKTDIVGFCEDLINLLGRQELRFGNGEILDKLAGFAQFARTIQENWSQIQAVIECFQNLTPQQRQESLRTLERLRERQS